MTTPTDEDRRWLDAAAREAMPLLGTTGDNPAVAAIIVDPLTRKLLGRAVTAPGGRPHAETQAIEDAGAAVRGATLYVTLEPCNHPGRTPPCVDAVLAAGIARVVVGVVDPDLRTAGSGVQRLVQAGLQVVVADHAPSRRLHEGHISRQTRKRPFVTAKLAVSADGKVGLPAGGDVPITGEVAGRWTDMQRALSDAVMLGWGTATVDGPQFNVQLKGLEGRTPLRVVMAGAKTYGSQIRLATDNPQQAVAVIAIPEKKLELPEGVRMIRVKGGKGRPDPALALAALAEEGVQNLLLEAGPTLLEALLAAGLVDRFHLLQGDRTVGSSGLPATPRGTIETRLAGLGFSLVDHRLLGADNLRTFERNL